MAEYIERDAALDVIEEKQRALCPVGRFGPSFVYGSDRETFFAWQEIFDSISAIPAADVAPVMHGRMEFHRCIQKFECNLCGHYVELGTDRNFCPNCGAKMDKGNRSA